MTICSFLQIGKELLKRELSSLRTDWDESIQSSEDAHTALEGALQAWNEFDDTHNALNTWLRNTEQTLKDYELRATLEEKQQQVGVMIFLL